MTESNSTSEKQSQTVPSTKVQPKCNQCDGGGPVLVFIGCCDESRVHAFCGYVCGSCSQCGKIYSSHIRAALKRIILTPMAPSRSQLIARWKTEKKEFNCN